MLEKFRKKNKSDVEQKATDRLAYMNASVPAWETQSMSMQRSRGYAALMSRFKGWVYAAAMINARGVASQTIKLYAKKPRGGMKSVVETRPIGSQKSAYLQGKMENRPSTFVQRKAMSGEVVEVFDHPILELLDNPSPSLDGYSLTIQRMLNLQLTGNAYLHPILSESLGVPIELWNMQSDLVSIVPDGELDFVDRYNYGKLPNIAEFRRDEVLHEKQANPTDPFYGKGWVEAAIEAIDLLTSMDEYEQNVLDNQARPDWAVMVKEHLTDAQYQRLYQQIEKRLGGKRNRSRPFIFEGGISGSPMQFSPQDLAFAEGEARKIEVIAAISGVSVTKLKANDPNLSNAREGNLGWLRDTIVPYLTLDEGFLNRQLVPMFGEFADNLFLAYDDPVQQDRSMQASINASDAAAGLRTRNEIRSDMGLPPVEGGDELLVPMGSVPIDIAVDQARNPQVPSFGVLGVEDVEVQDEKVEADEIPSLETARIEKGCGCGCKSGILEVQIKSLWERSRSLVGTKRAPVDGDNADWDRMLERNKEPIDSFRTRIANLFEVEINNVLDTGLNTESLLQGDSAVEVQNASADFVSAVLLDSGQREFEKLGIELAFDKLNPSVANSLDDFTSSLVETLTNGTRREIDRRIALGIRHGSSTDEIAAGIQLLLERDPETGNMPIQSRAEMIARTEVAMINEEGRRQAWMQSGVVKAKQWQLAAGACPICKWVASQNPNPIPLDQPFVMGGATISAGGKKYTTWKEVQTAPVHPNCRCGTVEMLDDETSIEYLEGLSL